MASLYNDCAAKHRRRGLVAKPIVYYIITHKVQTEHITMLNVLIKDKKKN